MELRHLRYFVAVAEELHFGRAARRLHIAQPPLSQQIRRLEAQLGTELLRRNRRRVELTEPGRLLLEGARPLLADADGLERLVRRAAGGEVGRLAVAYVGSATYRALPVLVRAFRERLPDVDLVLSERTTTPQVAALRARQVDAGIVRPPVADEGLLLEPLVAEALVAAVSDGHRLAAGARVAVAALADEPFVLFPRHVGTGLYDDVADVCRAAGFVPRVVQEAGDMQTIVSLVAAGVGVSLVPASVTALRLPGVAYRELDGPNATLALALATRRDDASPLVARFRAIARDAFVDEAPATP
jgi:DNA-binding transcriptional LysR family regulator